MPTVMKRGRGRPRKDSLITATAYVGVDPGSSGGLAVLYSDGTYELDSMPSTDTDVLEWMVYNAVRNVTDKGTRLTRWHAVIEKVGGYMPGSKGNIGSAMFKFGVSYGSLKMALTAVGIPFDEVIPNVWQRGIGLSPRKKTETKAAFKNRLKARAQQLFPGVHVTLDTADAILIAEFCRRKKSGEL